MHIQEKSEIAESVLMPGDPLRAKFIAENFLSNIKLFNNIRGILGYTGYFMDKKISILASGMGIGSVNIYVYELINFFGVKNIIRIGTCGSIKENVIPREIIVAMGACTDSNFFKKFNLNGYPSAISSWRILRKTYETSRELKIKIHVGNILTQIDFYLEDISNSIKWSKLGVLALDMETAALYLTCARYNTNALSILSVSDNLITKEEISSSEREKSLIEMIELALNTVIKL
ncbi:MAG: purine-nucleoside phosphorylase [Clostridiales bacterium]|jgi:purine-nucleoside phosphorylase|nr:purine-nucleoside phosphorylase [Clostridiales bacterium]